MLGAFMTKAPQVPEPRRREDSRKALEEAELRKGWAKVATFLKERGFEGIAVGRSSMFKLKTTYALHDAAELNELELVKLLIELGADPAQKNSRGETAMQRAVRMDVDGSHAEVTRFLKGMSIELDHAKQEEASVSTGDSEYI
jgi:ankyrin repeat protein